VCPDDLISVLSFNDEDIGGAHNFSSGLSHLWWVHEGIATNVRLHDLFTADSSWRSKLSAICMRELKKQDAGFVIDGSKKSLGTDDLKTFFLTPTGITFYFGPSRVHGDYEVTVAYKELRPQIDPRGPLARFTR